MFTDLDTLKAFKQVAPLGFSICFSAFSAMQMKSFSHLMLFKGNAFLEKNQQWGDCR